MVDGAALYQVFVVSSVYVLKLVNEAVNEPYMVRGLVKRKDRTGS
jgi:hypothetical protein